jgi:hypothetical protein
LPKFVVQIRKAKKFFYKSQLIWPTKLNKGGIKMKRKIVNFMTSFIMLSLLVSVLVIPAVAITLLSVETLHQSQSPPHYFFWVAGWPLAAASTRS